MSTRVEHPEAPADREQRVEQHSLFAEMRTPRSIGLLLLALVLACTFAALGQWQLQRATQNGTVVPTTVEHPEPLSSVATPQSGVHDSSVGQLVTTTGRYVPGDYVVVGGRVDIGRTGWWVTGHLITTAPAGAQLAVALGWTGDRATADRVAAHLNALPAAAGPVQVRGRYALGEQPQAPDPDHITSGLQQMAVPQLLNTWRTDTDGPVYNGYVVSSAAPAGLTRIYSPAPQSQVQLDLLNLFYAFEWAVFAVVAFYVWYRLVRDRWERLIDPEPVEDA